MVKDNLELLARVGHDWIVVYSNEVIGRRHNMLLPQWFDLIRNVTAHLLFP